MLSLKRYLRLQATIHHAETQKRSGPPGSARERLRRFLLERLRTVETEIEPGFALILDIDSEEQRHIFEFGGWEPEAVRLCVERLPPGGVGIDLGANIGLFTCAMAHALRGGDGRVIAFEPVKSNYRRLKENVKLNDLTRSVTPVRLAVGKAGGRLVMRRPPDGRVNNAVGSNMIHGRDERNVNERGWLSESVRMVTLDDWLAEHPIHRCDVIKVDLEGADLDALRGAGATLDRFRPAIVAEFNPYWMGRAGLGFGDVHDFFSARSYEISLVESGGLRALDRGYHPPAGAAPIYLAVPRQDRGSAVQLDDAERQARPAPPEIGVAADA